MPAAIGKNLKSKQFIWDTMASAMVLLLPFILFLRHNDYPILSSEAITIISLVFLTSLFFGLMMRWGHQPVRIILFTFSLVLLIDIQTTWITTIGLRLFLNIAVCVAISWMIRKKISQLMVLFFGAMVLVTIFQPTGQAIVARGEFPGPGTSDHPFVLHLILDEYAAPEALDIRYDQEEKVSTEVQNLFLDNDFTLFSRAYSRYFLTNESIPNTLNRGLRMEPNSFWDDSFNNGEALKQNDWFSRLFTLGYDIHVFQVNYLKLGHQDNNVSSSLTYRPATVHSLIGSGLNKTEKILLILSSYSRLSWFLTMFRDYYVDLGDSAFGNKLHLQPWDKAQNNFSTLSTMQIMNDLEVKIKKAKPGQAIFAHLLIPHSPYAFESDCTLKPEGNSWLRFTNPKCFPARNDSISRAVRYDMYLQQIQCTNNRIEILFEALKEAGVWENSLIIVHGDHGSRLNLVELFPQNIDQFVDSDFMDGYGTLLAVKFPNGTGTLNRQLVPLTNVFEQLFLIEDTPWPPALYVPDQEILDSPWVILNDRHKKMVRVPMRPFANGEPGTKPLPGESP